MGDFREQECFFFSKISKKKKKKKKVITFPKRHADNFLEIFLIVKTPYAFWSWICLGRFFDKNSEQECFFREQECLFFSEISKKKKKKTKIFFFFRNRFKKVISFPKRHADNFLEISSIVKTSYAFWSWICLGRFFDKIRKFPARKKFRPEAEISAEGRNPCRRQGSLLMILLKSILSGGPSRRQLYPSRWYRFLFFKKKAVAYRSLNL